MTSRPLLLVVAAALCAYGVAVTGTFVYDDHHSVAENTAIRTLANVPDFFWNVDMFSDRDNRMYRPVLLVTFALDHALGGGSVVVFKLSNLLLHVLNAVLLFGLAGRWGLGASRAVVAGVVFAVHPLASEAVNMISARSELLCMAGILGGLRCHLGAMRGRRHLVWGTALCGALACGSKATGVVLPALVLALELFDRRRAGRSGSGTIVAVVARLVPVVIVVVGYLVVRGMLFDHVAIAAPRLTGGHDPNTGAGRDLATQLALMAIALPKVLGQFVVPIGLNLDPPVTVPSDPFDVRAIGGAVLLAVLTAMGLHRGHRVRRLGIALAWASAAPWVLIPLNVPLSEHRLYGPLAGLALVTAALVPRTWYRRRRSLSVVASLGVALVFAALSAHRSSLYRDERLLWQAAHDANPASYRACYSLGACWMRAGDLERASVWMERALQRYPDYVSARRFLAECHLQRGADGDPVRAAALARSLVEAEPKNPFYRLLLSRALAAVGCRTGRAEDFDEAVRQALEVLEFAPPKALVYRTAANARRLQGDRAAAIALLDEAIRRGFDHPSALIDRHELLWAEGRREEALADLRRAAAKAPFDPRTLRALERVRASAASQPP